MQRGRFPIGAAALLLLAAATCPPAGATIRHVPDLYPTIQAGIDACAPGDTVLVSGGVYVENIGFPPFDITVASRYLVTGDPGWIEATQIRAAVAGPPVVSIGPGQTRQARLCGFTITGGRGFQGSGVHCFAASPAIDHNRITDNCPHNDGGGIHVADGGPAIHHNTITGN